MRRLSALVALASALTIGVGCLSTPRDAATAPPGRSTVLRPACTVSIRVGGVPTDVEAAAGAIWVAVGMAGIVRVDPSTNTVVARIRPGGSVTALARGLGAVWALDLFGERLLRIDPRTNRVVRATRVGSLPSAVAVGHGLVWVASQLESTVSGIDPRTGQVVKLALFAPGELWPGALAVSREGVWVVTGAGNEVSVFDPATMTFRRRLQVTQARTLAAVGDTAWVGVAGGRLLRIRGSTTVPVVADIRGDGYGPSLAVGRHLWVAERRDVLMLDLSGGAAARHAQLPRGTNAGPIAVRSGLWVVDGDRRELLRLHECGQRQEAIR